MSLDVPGCPRVSLYVPVTGKTLLLLIDNPNVCFAAEIGLAGEIRPVSKIDQRISEAKKLGYKTFVASKYNKITVREDGIKLILVGKIEEVFATLFA